MSAVPAVSSRQHATTYLSSGFGIVHTWDGDLLAIDRELHIGLAFRGRGKGARSSVAIAADQRWRARY